jgi:hypothetical protein
MIGLACVNQHLKVAKFAQLALRIKSWAWLYRHPKEGPVIGKIGVLTIGGPWC